MEPPQHRKPKQSRTSTSKKRTGCITCKKRHIRCDEAKPYCNNCMRNRGHCEGYAVDTRSSPPGAVQLCWDSRPNTRVASPVMQLQLGLDSVDTRDDTGMFYFREFVGLSQGAWNTAASNGDLWTVTMPQLAHSNGTLRHAAMAIGALSVWHRQSAHKTLRAVPVPVVPKAKEDEHYFHAVAYYCHSLKLQTRKASVQDAVFLSVLLLFFEMLRGNRVAALDHVNHGLAMMLAFLTSGDAQLRVDNFAPNPRPLLGELADIFTILASQARAIFRGRIGAETPLPNFVKGLKNTKQTMESFGTFLSQLPRSPTNVSRIPAVFNDLDEFEEHWVAARRGQTALAPILMELVQASGVLETDSENLFTKIWLELLGDPRVKAFCEGSSRTMQALDAAFQPLFNRILMSDVDSPTYQRAVHLRLQYLSLYIFDNTPQFKDVESLQMRTPMFHEYLSLAEVALRAARSETDNPAHRLSLQCGLSSYLLVTAFFCRDPLARDRAIWMLQDYPGQDGLYSTRSLYALALKNREVERTNAVEGTPTEQWQRLWSREFVFEDGGDRILFRYLDKNWETGEWMSVEDVAEVQEETGEMHWARQPLSGYRKLLMARLYFS